MVVRGLPTAVASLCCAAQVQGPRASVGAAHKLSLPWSVCNLHGLGIQPVSPALTGRFSATGSPGKSKILQFSLLVLKLVSLADFLLSPLQTFSRVHAAVIPLL